MKLCRFIHNCVIWWGIILGFSIGIIILGGIFMSIAGADEAGKWFCEQESGKRDGTVIWSCGIGEGLNEAAAREAALRAAFREFHMICDSSADCYRRPVTTDPQRTSCKHLQNGLWICTRLIISTLRK